MSLRTCPSCGGFFEGTGHTCPSCKPPAKNTRIAKGAALTPREKQVVTLVASGRSNKEIAQDLLLSEGTIKVYLSKIFVKLDVANRTALAIKVLNDRIQEERIAEIAQRTIKIRTGGELPPPTTSKPLDCQGIANEGKGKVSLK